VSSPEPRWVADRRALDELVATLLPEPAYALDTEFHRGLGLYDSTMVVVGSMIGL